MDETQKTVGASSLDPTRAAVCAPGLIFGPCFAGNAYTAVPNENGGFIFQFFRPGGFFQFRIFVLGRMVCKKGGNALLLGRTVACQRGITTFFPIAGIT